jgi:hypothetical protein
MFGQKEIWYLYRKKQHIGGGGHVCINHEDNDGNIEKEESWYEHAFLHKLSGPMCMACCHATYSTENMLYYMRGLKHRIDGPAVVKYYGNGNIEYEVWYDYGNLHRVDGPAYITYCQNGNIFRKIWYENGYLMMDKDHGS